MNTKNRILVTGGAGFVGSALCCHLQNAGYDVVAMDNLSNGFRENLPPDIPLLEMDICDQSIHTKLPAYNITTIIHCAAQASNELSFRDPLMDQKANQEGTLNLLEFVRKQQIRRFIFTSSMSIYGTPPQVPTPESTSCRPDSFYAVHKIASEGYIRIFAREYGLDYTIFRLYTTYGAGQNLTNRDQGLLSIYLSYILKKEPVLVKGPGGRKRDIVHVSDVVSAISRSLDMTQTYGKIYNVGTGISTPISMLIGMLLKEAGEDPILYPVQYTSGTSGDPFETQADISAIMQDIGWKPMISPEEGISMTLRRYRK